MVVLLKNKFWVWAILWHCVSTVRVLTLCQCLCTLLKWSIQDEVLCWTLPKLVIKHWSLSSKLNYRIIHHRISSRTKILCCTLLFTAKMFRSIYGQYILSGIYGRFILSGIYGRFILSRIYGRYILSHIDRYIFAVKSSV